jgi:hypothetical protein
VSDHHSAYLARAVAALSPEGHRRVDELLDQLAEAAGGHAWLVRFAKAQRDEADTGAAATATPEHQLSEQELDVLIRGFMTIRDTEQADDVADWANAVLVLLEDEVRSRPW